MRVNEIVIVVMVFSEFVALDCLKFQWSSNSTNKTRILLGGLFAVHEMEGTACGPLRRASVVKVESMAYAIQSINRRTDILPEAVLEFDIRDTCENSNVALEEVVEMMDFNTKVSSDSQPGVSGLIGATQSDTSIAIARLARLFQMPQISYSATASILSDTSMFDYFFRTTPSDTLQARAIADLIVHFNWTYIIVINSDDTYGRDGVMGLMEQLNTNFSSEICIVRDPKVTELSVNGNNDYDKVIDFILQEWIVNASVIVLYSQVSTALNMLEAVAEHSDPRLARLTWIAGDSWATRISDPRIGRVVRGMVGTIPTHHEVADFDLHLLSLNPNNMTNPWFSEYWEEVFNCTFNNSTTTSRSCHGSLKLNREDIEDDKRGTTNVIDAVYAYANAIHEMMADLCPSSSLISSCPNILKERFSKHVLNGELLREYLFNVSFNSSSTHEVHFDEFGDQGGEYAIVNMNTATNTKYVGTWNLTDLLQFSRDIWWSTGDTVPVSVCSLPCDVGHHPVLVPDRTDCCWTCERCLGTNTVSNGSMCRECLPGTSPDDIGGECLQNPIVFLSWGNPWAIIIMLGSGLGLAVTAAVAAVFIRFNSSKVIKASSRELCAILFVGVTVCYILPFFYLAKPSIPICTIRRLMIGLGFSICFSPMLLRANRIYRVFHTAPQTPKCAGPLYQVLFSCIFIAAEVVISIVWLVVEQPSIEFSFHSYTTELRCGESPYIGLGIMLLYNFSLLAFSTYFAFLSRQIPAKFNEVKFLGVTLYSVCIIWFASVPTYFATVRFGVVYQTTSLLMAVLFSATTALACLLLPKAVIVLWYNWKERKGEGNNGYTRPETEMTSNGTL